MCPPGIDQTHRLSQRWHLVVPTVGQARMVNRVEEPIFWSSQEDPLAGVTEHLGFGSKLARHSALYIPPRASRGRGHTSKSFIQSSKLFSLPVEIISSVFESLDSHDVLNFGLTCDLLLRLALERIDRDVRKYAGSWIDQPIAILGNYLRDLPASFFEDGLAYKSVNRKDLITIDIDNGHSFEPRRFHHLPAREFLWATDKFQQANEGNQSDLASWLDASNNPVPPALYADCPQRAIMKIALSQATVTECCFVNDACFAESGYYLRNLSNKSLVRLCACDGLDKAHVRLRNEKPEMTKRFMLDDVMLVQTRWSAFEDETWSPMQYFAEDPKGPWAGHRFDIVTVKAHDKQVIRGEWRDVTVSMLTSVAWEQEYAVGLKHIVSEDFGNLAKDEWSDYMSWKRAILRQGIESIALAEEISVWRDELNELCRKYEALDA